MKTKQEFRKLSQKIILCKKCPRLVSYIRTVAKVKVNRFHDHKYWGKPLPGFGDFNAKLLLIGLAPAAHGGNRTGRMFTGDSSGDWLYRALFDAGFAGQPAGRSRGAGPALLGGAVPAAARGAPPDNRPTPKEIASCSEYLQGELVLLRDVRVV